MDNNNIKTILVGESGVGKTNLINVCVDQSFEENSLPTNLNSYSEINIEINHKKYTIKLWDTIGQEKLRQLTKIFFKNSKIVILVYDKANKKSFKELDYWNNEVKKLLGDNIILAICGNKIDLDEDYDDVDEEEAREFAQKINAKFRLTSAKTNPNGFKCFLKELVIDYLNKTNDNNEDNDTVVLSRKIHNKNKRRGHCC